MTATELDPGNKLPRLLGITELADHLGVNVRHIRRLVHERRIPFIKWGHLIRFDPEDIRAWLDASRQTRPTAPPLPSPQCRRPAQAEPARKNRSGNQLPLEP
jgi:excisionase family DNA binding protein